jgi:glycosyltransferase involved in cell wall biosynthesis
VYLDNISSNIQFFIFGDGPEKLELIDLVIQLDISSHVKFFESVPESNLVFVLSKCHVGVSPFSPERGQKATISALKTYDYILNKLAILTSTMDEMGDFIESNEIGVVINIFNKYEIANSIKKILDVHSLDKANLAFNKNMGNWLKEFSWEARFEKIKIFIEGV